MLRMYGILCPSFLVFIVVNSNDKQRNAIIIHRSVMVCSINIRAHTDRPRQKIYTTCKTYTATCSTHTIINGVYILCGLCLQWWRSDLCILAIHYNCFCPQWQLLFKRITNHFIFASECKLLGSLWYNDGIICDRVCQNQLYVGKNLFESTMDFDSTIPLVLL